MGDMLRMVHEHPDAELTGICDAQPERMREGIRKFHAALTEAGIQHVYWESPGTDHEWQTWRRNLLDFAPRLFK